METTTCRRCQRPLRPGIDYPGAPFCGRSDCLPAKVIYPASAEADEVPDEMATEMD